MANAQPKLAIEGGPPMVPTGPPGWPPADEEVRQMLAKVAADGSWGRYLGDHRERLEESLAEFHQASHVLTCCSGTFAVELGLRAMKLGQDDEVLLAGYDFPGNFRAIEAVSARPMLVDLAPDGWAPDLNQVAEAITGRTRAIVVSHLHSSMAPMRLLRELCDRKGIGLLEDACQAPGATIDGRLAGRWGNVGILSFGGSKLLTAGRGGAMMTDDPALAQRAKVYCERGNDAYPLSELQAAVLLPQVSKVAERNARRVEAVRWLGERLASLEALTPAAPPSSGALPAYYKLAWYYHPSRAGETKRKEFLQAVQAEGIALDEGFRGFTRRPASRCGRLGALTQSERAATQTVLLHHPVLLGQRADWELVARGIEKVITHLRSHG